MTFLQYVAKDILAKHGADHLADVAVIFPNKRASLFLNQALYEETGHPLWSPAYYTISDLFRQHSTLTVPDQMSLIFKVYNIYTALTGSSESLDHFFSWGQLILSDFDDLDKNLVDADKLFIDLEAWQEMRDFSFLSEQQRKSLEEFFGKVTDDTELQHKFNETWRILRPLYHTLKDELRQQGLAYEGMLYRDVVERGIADLHYKHYIFVGFNLLQKVEQRLFRLLRDKGLAEFYWDYDKYFMRPGHEAGRFISQYIERFPNELSPGRASAGIDTDDIFDNIAKPKDITYVSAPTEDIQARYAIPWLNERIKAGTSEAEKSKTAIVLADERLLQNVVHSLPDSIGKANITTGYPLAASPAATLVYALLNLQFQGLTKDGDHYRLADVNQILRHPYAKYLSDDTLDLFKALNEHKTFYPSRRQLTEGRDENLAVVFRKLTPDPANGHGDEYPILPWIADVLKAAGIGSRDKQPADEAEKEKEEDSEMQMTHEAIFRMYTLIHRLDDLMTVTLTGLEGERDGKQLVSTTVLQRLLSQLINATSIPFHGEPAVGVQIMGVLETRNLDFDNVLLLSCNEGNLPKGVNDVSFIPHSLRKGFEMTTVENKVAIYSYYFHSLLQRARHITFCYNNAADDGKQGEMSRFMLQYMVEKDPRQVIHRRSLLSGQSVATISRQPKEKTGVVKERLRTLTKLSPTALSRYLRCELQFYYATICGLYEQQEDTDEIDNAIFGNIFHQAAEDIYRLLGGPRHEHTITREAIAALLKDKAALDRILDQAFREKLFQVKDPAFQPHYNGLQLLNRNVLRIYLERLLRLDATTAPFDILALEDEFYDNLTFQANGREKTIQLGGRIDRLDRISYGGRQLIRVIDYKTGKPISAAAPSVKEIFQPDFVDSKHTVYYLQAFLYAAIIRRGKQAKSSVNKGDSPVAPALLFIRQAAADDYNPILKVKDEGAEGRKRASYSTVDDINKKDVYDDFAQGLRGLLHDIFDEERPFMPTQFVDRCENCIYKNICGM